MCVLQTETYATVYKQGNETRGICESHTRSEWLRFCLYSIHLLLANIGQEDDVLTNYENYIVLV